MQAIAAGWHFKSDAQIARLAALVGPARIMVVHGTKDNMITFPHGVELLAALGGEEAGITKRFIEGQGHVIPIEMRQDFNQWVEALVEKTEAMKSKKAIGNGVNGHARHLPNGHIG
jgi:fermentation-respiration switch protein FrsA (DUF1100 family)